MTDCVAEINNAGAVQWIFHLTRGPLIVIPEDYS
jgi:hypothetical protein